MGFLGIGFTKTLLPIFRIPQESGYKMLIALFLLGLVSGTIDAMAGGGGLLVVPGLMALGFDPVAAFSASKLQGVFGSLSATVHFWRRGKIRLRQHRLPVATVFFSSVIGAVCLTTVDPQALKSLIPWLLIAIALWLLFSPTLGDAPTPAKLSPRACALTILPLIGFYNGFFGPGTGTFFALALVSLLGLTLGEATIRTKLYNLIGNLGGFLVFLYAGSIPWRYGGVMVVGTWIGGSLGARLVLRHGTRLIRPLVVIMTVAMSIKLLWQQGVFARLGQLF